MQQILLKLREILNNLRDNFSYSVEYRNVELIYNYITRDESNLLISSTINILVGRLIRLRRLFNEKEPNYTTLTALINEVRSKRGKREIQEDLEDKGMDPDELVEFEDEFKDLNELGPDRLNLKRDDLIKAFEVLYQLERGGATPAVRRLYGYDGVETTYQRQRKNNPGGKLGDVDIGPNTNEARVTGFREYRARVVHADNISRASSNKLQNNSTLSLRDRLLSHKSTVCSEIYNGMVDCKSVTVVNPRGHQQIVIRNKNCENEMYSCLLIALFAGHLSGLCKASKLPYECVYRDGFGYLQPSVCSMPGGIRLDPGIIPHAVILCIYKVLSVLNDRFDDLIDKYTQIGQIKVSEYLMFKNRMDHDIDTLITLIHSKYKFDSSLEQNQNMMKEITDECINCYLKIRGNKNTNKKMASDAKERYLGGHVLKYDCDELTTDLIIDLSRFTNAQERIPTESIGSYKEGDGSDSETEFDDKDLLSNSSCKLTKLKSRKITVVSGMMSYTKSLIALFKVLGNLSITAGEGTYYEVEKLITTLEAKELLTTNEKGMPIVVQDLNPVQLYHTDIKENYVDNVDLDAIKLLDVTSASNDQIAIAISCLQNRWSNSCWKKEVPKILFLLNSGTKYSSGGLNTLTYGTIRIIHAVESEEIANNILKEMRNLAHYSSQLSDFEHALRRIMKKSGRELSTNEIFEHLRNILK